jgi:hypothetical protein
MLALTRKSHPERTRFMQPTQVCRKLSVRQLALVASLAIAAPALAAEPTREQLQQQLKDLQGRVEQLQARQQAGQDQQTVDAVMNDASGRGLLMADDTNAVAGHDEKGFFLGSGDGNFMLRPGILFKFRNTTNSTENVNGTSDDRIQNGFEVRQMKLFATGNVFGKDLTYRFQFDTLLSTGVPFFQDAFFRYKLGDYAIKAGQFRDPVYHESLVWDGYQLAVDRALVSFLIGGEHVERVQGADFSFDPSEKFHANVMYHDGLNTDNTDFEDNTGGSALLGGGPDFGVSGRLEYIAQGNRGMYDTFTALGNTEDLLAFGAGFDWTQGGDVNAIFHTADVQWEPQALKGFAAYAAYLGVYRNIGTVPPGADDSFYDWGFIVQGAYLLTDKLEVFARYDLTNLDSAALAAGADATFNEITLGVNYYWHKQNAKFTADVVFLPDGAPTNVPGCDILASSDNEIVFRTQFQLLL